MVGIITQSTSLNSFWSISFCVLALGLHSYATYLAVQRYKEAAARAWPGPSSKGGTPGEVAACLALLVLASLCLPFFVVGSFLRVGNYGNDGVKLGRDHALNPNLDAWCRKVKSPALRRVWRNCVPLAQTFYLAAAFLILLPDTLLTAVEVDYGYRTTDSAWSSDVDFLFEEERTHMSDVMGSINLTNTVANGSRVVVPTPHPPPGGWGSDHSLSLAFVNFVLALLTFGIRYASVFWYTNKVLTIVFALQLLALTLTATFGYSAFSCLYKVCYNGDVYINVQLSLACSTSLALYVAGSAVMLLSTMTVFEYGSHYFAEKLRIIERKHRNPESFVKQTIVVNSGCQGYVPHSCAMAALVAFAACKGPVIYDLVSLYRPTQDRLVLTGLVCEVCYMVLWIALWFGLTVKQRWQFRILDYVPLGQPLFMIQDDQIVKNPTFDRSSGSGDGNSLEMAELPSRSRRRSRNGGESPPGYLDAVDNGSGDVTPDHDPANSEAGTEDSDTANLNDNMADIDCLPSLSGNGGGAMRKVRSRGRRHGGPRVTFDDSVRSNGRRASGGGGGGDGDPAAGHSAKPGDGSRHLNVKADVHSNVKSSGSAVAAVAPPSHSGDGSAGNLSDARAGGVGGGGGVGVGGVGGVKLRKQNSQTENTLSREYRNSIRSKCDDFYAVVEHPCPSDNLNNLSPQPDAAVAPPPSSSSSASSSAPAAPHEPLPTLMSSFRDKVKESSRTASTYREQRRNLQLGNYGSLERQTAEYPPGLGPPAPGLTNGVGGGSLADLERQGCDKRRGIMEGELGEVTLRLDDSLDSGVRSSKRGSTVSGSDDDRHNHSFQHDARSSSNNPGGIHHLVPRCNSLHKQSNSVANSTFESENSSLPSITENRQPGVAGGVSDKPPRQLGKMDYLSIDKAGPAFPRSLHMVPRTKAEIGRRDSANYSLTSSQETSSNDSDHGQGLCSQNGNAPKPK